MSHVVNNLALTLSEIPLRTFIKETESKPIPAEKANKFKLDFKGAEAKSAYEEIISIETKEKPLPRHIKNTQQKKKKVEKVSNNDIDESSISINTLFKAIETKDKKFIFKYFNVKNVNISDQFGWTPLMSAAYTGSIEIVEFLLKLGANIKLKDKSGLTAVDLATKRNNLEIVNLLKQKLNESNKNKSRDEKISDSNKVDNKLVNKKEKESLYCDICKIYFTESSKKKHESSTLHVFNTHPKIKSAYYGIPKCNRGYQMLLNKGWDEEGGLGPSGDGQQYPVKTVLKRDRKGLGEESVKKRAKVTHFNPRDVNAVKHVHHHKQKVLTKKDRKKQLDKDAAKTRALREALK